jgi:hypothetical protein
MKRLVGILSLFLSIGAFAAEGSTTPARNELTVQFGKPTYVQRLYYRRMYEKKPFREAVLFYYDNGLYKIISPGEDHYGTYVVQGRFEDKKYKVHFISLPSPDWGNTTAHHFLEFDRGTHRFKQQALTQADQRIPPQHGDFSQAVNTQERPLDIHWDNGKDLGAPIRR